MFLASLLREITLQGEHQLIEKEIEQELYLNVLAQLCHTVTALPRNQLFQSLDRHWQATEHYPVDSAVCFAKTYLLDRNVSDGQHHQFEKPDHNDVDL